MLYLRIWPSLRTMISSKSIRSILSIWRKRNFGLQLAKWTAFWTRILASQVLAELCVSRWLSVSGAFSTSPLALSLSEVVTGLGALRGPEEASAINFKRNAMCITRGMS